MRSATPAMAPTPHTELTGTTFRFPNKYFNDFPMTVVLTHEQLEWIASAALPSTSELIETDPIDAVIGGLICCA
jgi:hypothetical protein